MRCSVLTLALYLCFLALFPCQDLVSVAHTDEVATYDEHDCPDDEDHCTTLCACACCGVLSDTPPAPEAFAMWGSPPPSGSLSPDCVPAWKPIQLPGLDVQPPIA